MCDCCFSIVPPRTVFEGFCFVSEGWMLLHKELIIDRDSPHIAMQHMTTFQCSLDVVAGVSVL